MGDDVEVLRAEDPTDPGWLALRLALWSDVAVDEHLREMAAVVAAPDRYVAFLVRRGPSTIAFVEASLRHDHVNGTTTSPVAFLEGLSVAPEAWRRGHARRLVDAVAAWGRARGCRELASDALVENDVGIQAHRALGFEETERVVYFRRAL